MSNSSFPAEENKDSPAWIARVAVETAGIKEEGPGFIQPSSLTLGEVWGRQRFWLLLIALLYLALFWPAIAQWYSDCREMDDFSHCLLIPFICGGILFYKRREILKLPWSRGYLGLVVFLLSLPVYFSGLGFYFNAFQRIGAYGCFIGLAAFLFGTRLVRSRPFPFLYLSLAIPLPFELHQNLAIKLRGIATALSASFLQLLGVPALNDGNILSFGEHRLDVVDACSGIRSLMAIVSLALLFSYLFKSGWIGGAMLLVLSLPVVVLANVFRIVFQAWFLHYWNLDFTQGLSHDILGMVVFMLSMALLYAAWIFLRWLLDRGHKPRVSPAA